MNAEGLLQHYERIADAPDAIGRLRQFVLELAVRGKLVPQDSKDEPATALLKRIAAAKARLGISQDAFPLTQEQIPFLLPPGWSWSNIGEVCSKTGSGSTPRGGQAVYKDAGIPFLRSQNVYDDGLHLDDVAYIDPATHARMAGTAVLAKDLLLNITGGSIGRCCRVPDVFGEANVSQHVAIIRAAIPELADYLHRLVLSPHFQSFVVDEQTGAGRGGLPKNRMDRIPVALPPLAEQHRIVVKVDELMALCDRLESARAKREAARDRLAAASLARLNAPDPETFQEDTRFALDALPALTARPDQIKQLRQTILNLAVRGKLVPQDPKDGTRAALLERIRRIRQSKFREQEDEVLLRLVNESSKRRARQYVSPDHEEGRFDVPDGWLWASTLEVCECVENGNTPAAADMIDGSGEIPFIKVYNLTKTGALDFSVKPTFISRATHEGHLARSRIRPGDVLMNIVGPPLGKVSVVPGTFSEWNTNQAVVLFRPLPIIHSTYLAICLLSTEVLSWIIDLAQQTVGQVNISVSKSRRLPIPVPPLAEQHRIVAKVADLMTLCDRLEAQLANGAAYRSRLLEALLLRALDNADSLARPVGRRCNAVKWDRI
jgi:type I restriction enzyme S subunit